MTLAYLPWNAPNTRTTALAVRDATAEYTYSELCARADAFAEQLDDLGLRAGDVLAVVLPNSAALTIAMLGAWRLGLAVTPVNPTFTAREYHFQLADSGAKAVVGTPPEGGATLIPTIAPEQMQTRTRGALPPREPAGDDLALLIYTSGSTGRPKGVMLEHRNLAALVTTLVQLLELSEADHCLLVLPLFHVNSILISLLAPLAAGAGVTVLERFAPDRFVAAVQEYRPTYFSAVPAIFARIVEHPDTGVATTGSLRFAICGAAPASVELLHRAEARLGIPILEGYGLTEATCASACNPLRGARKPGTVGPALPGQRIVIVDDHGRVQPNGHRGEVLIAGSTVMRGYLNQPETTARTVVDGWLHTGDVGVLDDDGYLQIVDRIKDMIIRGGENIYPKEIESVLAAHPGVLESAVIGRPDAVYGELPVAMVVLAPDAAPATAEQLLAHCRNHLAKVKVPSAIELVESLPRNPVGKVDKPAMRRAFAPV